MSTVPFDKEEMATLNKKKIKKRLNEVIQGKMSCHTKALTVTVTETLGVNQCQSVKVISLDKRGTSTLKKGC